MFDEMRVGFGYDFHPFYEGRKLILGGVEIPFDKGLKGVSDADVILHAVIDALFGAAGLPDIGDHFPPEDSKYKDVSSTLLLAEALNKVRERKFEIVNVDITVILDEPRLTPYKERIKNRLAELLGVPEPNIGLKAKTKEGRLKNERNGIEAYAVVLLREVKI